LISFSQDEWACQQIFVLNFQDRLINLLKGLTYEANSSESENLIVELTLLLISNLTQSKEGVLKFLHIGENEHMAVHFIYLFERFMNPKFSLIYKFAGNIFANLTAIKEARDLLILPEYQLLLNLIHLMDSPIKEIRLGCLHTLRNLSFEYESNSFQDQIFNEKVDYIESLIKIMGKITFFGDVDEKIKGQMKSLGIVIGDAWKDVKFIEEITIVLDALLVLTNINEIEQKIKFPKEKLSQVIIIMKPGVPTEIKDKIDVILCIFCQLNPQHF